MLTSYATRNVSKFIPTHVSFNVTVHVSFDVQYMTQVTYANLQKSFHLTAVNPQKWAAYTCAHTRKASSADVRILSNIVYGTVY